MAKFLLGQMDYIFFVCGLMFIIIAGVSFKLYWKDPIRRPWMWLVLFGLLQGLNEWMDVLALMLPDTLFFKSVRLIGLALSFVALAEFGRRGLFGQDRRVLVRSLILLSFVFALAVTFVTDIGTANAVLRYIIGFPGAVLTSLAFFRIARMNTSGIPRAGARVAGVSMLVYAVVAGLVVPAVSWPPASWLNNDVFLSIAGVPVQAVRMLCALFITVGIWFYSLSLAAIDDRPVRVRRELLYPLAILFLISMGWVATESRGDMEEMKQREWVLGQATKIAQVINPDLVKMLSFTSADKDSPAYQRIREQMIAHGKYIRHRSIWSVALRKGSIIFGPENLDPDDPIASPPGSVYEKPSHKTVEIFNTAESCVVGPYDDEFGTFISALAPVLDPRDGKVLMAVGMDIFAADFYSRITAARMFPIFCTMLIILLVLVGLTFIGEQYRSANERLRDMRYMEVVFTVIVGMVLTVMVTLLIGENETRNKQRVFDLLAREQTDTLRDIFFGIREDLIGLANLFESSIEVDLDEFSTFTAPILSREPIQAYAWVPRVSQKETMFFETRVRESGLDGFYIYEKNDKKEKIPVSGRDEYYPVLYIEPRPDYETAIGFDVGSEKVRRSALKRSLNTGLRTATDPLELATGQKGHRGSLIFQPVFRNGNIFGFVIGIVDLQSVFTVGCDRAAHVKVGEGMVRSFLVDLMASEGMVPQAVCPQGSDAGCFGNISEDLSIRGGKLMAVNPLFIFGRAYAVVAYPGEDFYKKYPSRDIWIAALGGAIFTVFLTVFVGFLRRQSVVLERQVEARTTELKGQTKLLETIFYSTPGFLVLKDIDLKYIKANPAFCDLVGYPPGKIIGKTDVDFFAQEDADDHRRMDTQVISTGMPVEYERNVQGKKGSRLMSMAKVAIHDDKGSVIGVLWSMIDVTEHEQAERNQRLASLGQLVSNVAHEVNNPLMIISGNAQLCLEEGTGDVRLKDKLGVIVEQAKRARDVIQKMLKFSQHSSGELKRMNIEDGIETVLGLMENKFGPAKITIKRNYAKDVPLISVDERQMQEVYRNILNNAQEAMPNGGIIEITVVREGDFVRIDFKDTGCGMPEDIKARIFEPFFSTKENNPGLGLPITYSIIKAHKGEISYKSLPEKGTTVSLLLPIND